MKRVLVTGAEGFTGLFAVEHFARLGFDVHGIVREGSVPLRSESLVSCHALDLRNPAAIDAVVGQVRPEGVVHLAGISSPAHGNIEEIYQTNLFGTRNLLSSLAQLSAPPQSVILASSANVYHPGAAGQIDESAALAPINDYGISKLAMEYLRGVFASRLPIIVTRPFNYTGLGQSPNFLIPKVVAALRRKAEVVELGNIDVSRDWSDVRFVADCYARLLTSTDAIGQTFNICSGRAVSLREIIAKACEIAGHNIEIAFNPQFARANEIPMLCGDNSRLGQAIGCLDPIPIETTLRWMLEAK